MHTTRALRLFPLSPPLAILRTRIITEAQDVARDELNDVEWFGNGYYPKPENHIASAGAEAREDFNDMLARFVCVAMSWDGKAYEDCWQFAYCELCEEYDEYVLGDVEEACRKNSVVVADELARAA